MAIFCFGKTMSGLPAIEKWERYPFNPTFRNARLNNNSGPVSRPRLALITTDVFRSLGTGALPSLKYFFFVISNLFIYASPPQIKSKKGVCDMQKFAPLIKINNRS